MSELIIYTIISVSAIGILAALILYLVAQKFKVYEDPRIDKVDEQLPGANCGGCGYAGCRNFAEACVKADSLDDLNCPVGGNECMAAIAKVLGKEVAEKEAQVAVVCCAGSPQHRAKINEYDGEASCVIADSLYAGETGCQFGCLGHGDCVEACDFEAIYINSETGLPEVTDDNCTACGACVTACPRDIIELRKKNKKDRKIYVSCVNKDKGAIAKKACEVACIGCKKCVKECPFDAITVENFLAYIDPNKCKLCRKCVAVCPTNAIVEVNFPPKRKKTEPTAKKTEPKQNATTQKSEQTPQQKEDKTTKEHNDNK